VRELHNEIQRMTVLSDGNAPLAPELLSPAIRNGEPAATASDGAMRQLKDIVAEVERSAIESTLARHDGNISRSADELGLSRVGLRSKIERYDLKRYPDDETD
jgi:two-component system response regulator HupR/HoxA